DAALVAHVSEQCQGPLCVQACRGKIATSACCLSQQIEGECDASPVSQFPAQRQALLAEPLCLLSVVYVDSQARSSLKSLRPHGCHDPPTSRQGLLQEAQPLTDVTMHYPKPPQGCTQSQSCLLA